VVQVTSADAQVLERPALGADRMRDQAAASETDREPGGVKECALTPRVLEVPFVNVSQVADALNLTGTGGDHASG
jgi:hypothetical protein